jgi:hypothetical protein
LQPAISAHLRYIQKRERGEHKPERKFFDRWGREDKGRGVDDDEESEKETPNVLLD